MTVPAVVPFYDCHAHVYERVYAVGRPRYLPTATAPRDAWISHLQANGVAGGVIVQISFLGTDNSEMLAALRTLGTQRFRGIAVVPLDMSEEELLALHAEGIRGVRWNLVAGAALPDPANSDVRDFLRRLNRVGLHLQIQLEGHRLGPYLRKLAPIVDRIVVDHFGIPTTETPMEEPWINALTDLAPSSDIWVKFSGPYRSPVDVAPHAQAILNILGPTRIVWGSDWPWTNHERKHDYKETVRWIDKWLNPQDRARLERASQTLYGFAAI